MMPHLVTIEEYPWYWRYMRSLMAEDGLQVTIRPMNGVPFLKVPTAQGQPPIYVSVADWDLKALEKHHTISYEPCHHSALEANDCPICQQSTPR